MKNSREARAFLLLVVVFAAAAFKAPRLLEASALGNILVWIPLLAVMAVGQMLVIVSRGIDVSIGSILAFSGLSAGLLFRAHPQMGLPIAALVAVSIGLVLGFVNGALIAWVKIPPIITTLGTLSAYRGMTFILAQKGQIYRNDIPTQLIDLSIAGPFRIGGITVSWLLIIALLICSVAYVFTTYTVAGRNLYALGSNAEASRLHGIRTNRLIIFAYTIAGGLSGFAGLLYLSRFGFLNPASAGVGMELTIIAAVVIGGCDVRGGEGTVLGALIGCAILGTINVALSVVGIESDWQLLVYGAVILVALGLDAFVGRRARA